MKILFLIKENGGYGNYSTKSGLLESAKLTSGQLHKKLGVWVKLVTCFDGNSIDREVYLFKPDMCLIEAIWVTPDKLSEIVKLHPRVKFIVRVHSEIPFLAMEGTAIEWIKEYVKIKNVSVSFNSLVTKNDFESIGIQAVYLPNIYSDLPINKERCYWFSKSKKRETINIGCFGSIRPLKNQLLQAVAAIQFGEKNNISVNLHINGTRIEQKGESALKNIRSLFDSTDHTLIEHNWLPREDFLSLVSTMDIGLQVSFSESFNLVTADFVYSNVPIIVSEVIDWMPSSLKVENDVSAISDKISNVLRRDKYFKRISKRYLSNYNSLSLMIWEDYLRA